MGIFSAILPLFYLALYRDEGTWQIPRRLRLLSLAAAVLFGMIVAIGAPAWIESLGLIRSQSVLSQERAPWSINDLAQIMAQLSNFAYILLLVTMYRQVEDERQPDVPASKLLAVVTKIAVIFYGLWVTFNLIRLALTPYSYSQLRDYALRIGRTPPPFQELVKEAIRAVLTGSCMFAAPYVVWATIRSQRAARPCPDASEEAQGSGETE
ncbi:MAG TPA: hypothetical protein VNY05_43220 [Candidatus Acidoferrales bacterium]|nr:hypothetical protein [Candidatus Acidoferrales bacterium]